MYIASINVQHSSTIKCGQRRQTADKTVSVVYMLTHWVAEARNVVMETEVTQMLQRRQSADYDVNAVGNAQHHQSPS